VGTFTRDDAIVRTGWLSLARGVAATVVGAALSFAGLMSTLHDLTQSVLGWRRLLVVALLAAAPWFIIYFFRLRHLRQNWLEERGRLQANERGLWLEDSLILARRVLRRGDFTYRDGIAYVRLEVLRQGRRFPVEVVVEDAEEAAVLPSALRLDAPQSVGTYRLNYGTYRSPWIAACHVSAFGLPVVIGLSCLTQNAILVLASLWAIAVTVWLVTPFVLVSVGADGIHLLSVLSRSRFIPFGAVTTAETRGRNVTICLRDGGTETMYDPSNGRDRADEGQLLVYRINEQLDRHGRDGAEIRALLRGARTTSDWIKEVSRASDEHASFRSPAVPADDLWRVLADPVAVATARAGAALALRDRLDDGGRARLRVIADACAAPKLRVALRLAASDAKAEALEEVFDGLQDDEPSAE
jgi:hypothetical protein